MFNFIYIKLYDSIIQLFIFNWGFMTTELVESYVKAYNQALENVQLLKEELYSFFTSILEPVNIETEHLVLHLTTGNIL